jgi:hypothetical protein
MSLLSSGDINGHNAAQDGIPEQSIPTGLNGAPADKVHAAPEQSGKFILHVLVLEQTPPRVWSERNQEVDILGARRLDEHGSEQFEFGNLPLPAKRFQLSLVNRQPLQNCHICKDNAEPEGPDH